MRRGADRMVAMNTYIQNRILQARFLQSKIDRYENRITAGALLKKECIGKIHDAAKDLNLSESQWQEITEFAKLHGVQL